MIAFIVATVILGAVLALGWYIYMLVAIFRDSED